MKLSLNWIRDYVDLPQDMDLKRLAYDLTMSTVEVEDAEDLARRFDHMIVGVVQEVCQHPNADKLKVFKMNVDENPATPARFGIRAIPTLIIFKDGNAVEQHTGSMPKDQLRQLIDSKAF